MYSSEFSEWRRQVLSENQLLTVILFPHDLFYPTAVESIAIVLKKGVPHQEKRDVLWVRMTSDGFRKWKGFRIESGAAPQDFIQIAAVAKAWILDDRKIDERTGYWEFHPIVGHEIVPQAHLGGAPVNGDELREEEARLFRELTMATWRRR